VRVAERLDGKFVVHSNDDTLNAEDLALGYKQLMRGEETWRTPKSGLKLRPVFHWAPHRIHAHVALTVLSLLLERVAEHSCQDTWRNIRDDLKQIKEEQRRDQAHKSAMKLADAQIDALQARTQLIQQGGGLIQVDMTGAQPALEAVLWSLVENLQLRVNQSAADLLLAIP
jgi:transposase